MPMTGRRWIVTTLSAIAAAMALTVAVSYCIDPYSLWHDSAGKKLVHYSSGELEGKLLLNKNYVPTNFNGLIVGSSSTENWDIPDIDGIRFYNESAPGTTGANEKLLVDQAMKHRQFKAAIVLMAPHMVANHEGNPEVEAFRESEALGSIFILEQEFFAGAGRVGFNTKNFQTVEWNGKTVFDNPMGLKGRVLPDHYFDIDPALLDKYLGVIQSLKNQGATIIYVESPLYQPCLDLNKERAGDFDRRILSALPPAPFLDLDSPEYQNLRTNSGNFVDCFHSSDNGAQLISAIVTQFAQKTIDEQNRNASPGVSRRQ
jgi:hypothetical protein